MEASLFDYHLPRELIAQKPPKRRDQSRLLILDRNSGELTHASFREISRYLRAGDVLVVNDTRVFKARLLGRRRTGGAVDILLIRKHSGDREEIWEAMVKPSRRVKEGEPVLFGERQSVRLLEDMGNGRWQVGFESSAARTRIVSRYGHVPLPPYINREDQPQDTRRYQTVYADPDRTGAIAAPTAGFHFTGRSLANLAEKGVEILKVTLHVGPGTFKPIQTDAINDHVVDPEQAELSPHVATRLNRVRRNGGAVFAVGTTTVRMLESAPIRRGEIQPFSGMVDLYIRPGHRFRVVDHLITNFHLPKTSLLVLVSAFAGRESVLEAYRQAIHHRYRFYSYGDAMLVL